MQPSRQKRNRPDQEILLAHNLKALHQAISINKKKNQRLGVEHQQLRNTRQHRFSLVVEIHQLPMLLLVPLERIHQLPMPLLVPLEHTLVLAMPLLVPLERIPVLVMPPLVPLERIPVLVMPLRAMATVAGHHAVHIHHAALQEVMALRQLVAVHIHHAVPQVTAPRQLVAVHGLPHHSADQVHTVRVNKGPMRRHMGVQVQPRLVHDLAAGALTARRDVALRHQHARRNGAHRMSKKSALAP